MAVTQAKKTITTAKKELRKNPNFVTSIKSKYTFNLFKNQPPNKGEQAISKEKDLF